MVHSWGRRRFQMTEEDAPGDGDGDGESNGGGGLAALRRDS